MVQNLKTKIKKMGGPGGGIRREFFFEFFAFQKIESREVVEYAATIIFHPPPWGYPPWYAQEGSDKVKISEIFGATKRIFF